MSVMAVSDGCSGWVLKWVEEGPIPARCRDRVLVAGLNVVSVTGEKRHLSRHCVGIGARIFDKPRNFADLSRHFGGIRGSFPGSNL